MANFFLHRANQDIKLQEPVDKVKSLKLNNELQLSVYGKEHTYFYAEDQENFVAVIGYACHPDQNSAAQTCFALLKSFSESHITSLKKSLTGQFVMIIKRARALYIFSDFCGCRNIFYSPEHFMLSSSFTQIENLLDRRSNTLNESKVFEYLAMRYVIFPTWLGSDTMHTAIKWLLPFEYVAINLSDTSMKIHPVVYPMYTHKSSECRELSQHLLTVLKSGVQRNEYSNEIVAASLTGGRDTRLVAALAADYYKHIRYRIAVSPKNVNSQKDLQVAQKVAHLQQIPLDAYEYSDQHETMFYEITEGMTPAYNSAVTPLITSSNNCALGFGGVLGSQLFWAIPWVSIKEFVDAKVEWAKKFLCVKSEFWDELSHSLLKEFERIRQTFLMSQPNDKDFIRLFQYFYSARYSSFILSAYNISGMQLEPYASYPALEMALRISPELWGNHRRLGGDALVQKTAMALLNPQIGKIITYSSYRPMLPLSVSALPLFMAGYVKHYALWVSAKVMGVKRVSIRTDMLNAIHISDGWEKPFITRTIENYGVAVDSRNL